MILRFCLLLCFFFLVRGTNGDTYCIPRYVENLRINVSAVLSWEVHQDETCGIKEFQVDVEAEHQEYEMHFLVRFQFVDLSFLPVCDEWHFVVTPISENNVLGYERRLVGHVPLPSTADISLSYFDAIHVNTKDILLQWDLQNRTQGDCTLRYRIVIENKETGDVQDVYVSGLSIILHNLSPCVEYHIAIRAVNIAHPTIEGPMLFQNVLSPSIEQIPPTLLSVKTGPTSIDMTWGLENWSNRCPVRALHIDGGSKFNISVPIQDSTDDRPPVEVNLKGLQPNSMYYLKVAVENSGGMSQASQIAVQTDELGPGR
ncbi:hypothetical protein NQ315_001347 [Exocentrus adspersus]|uniref:Fibronectin type-III domain-containing protein n=1 Tax=Exocentrus adspersus TaxID=1586481 RepID=A0AAV8WG03_9CUCU|nr:hypothetical protein NQ315_001347 [Exocentrus adspersus]